MESLTSIPNTYLTSTDAAVRFGVTKDHIASLCRRKKVAGILSNGRQWFVDPESLEKYLVKSKTAKSARGRALSTRAKGDEVELFLQPITNEFLARLAYGWALAFALVGATLIIHPAITPVIALAGDIQAESYQTIGAVFMSSAEVFVDGAYAFNDLQVGAYETAIAALYDTADTMTEGLFAASDASFGAVNGAVVWYASGSDRIVEKTNVAP